MNKISNLKLQINNLNFSQKYIIILKKKRKNIIIFFQREHFKSSALDQLK